jgi:branched-chain amino acid transport system substrate-binding protein
MAVAAYDGMAAIAHVVEQLHGNVDGDGAMKALAGWRRESPRGPITIDPGTRDIVQNVYLRRVEKRGDHYDNVEFDKVPEVKDPGKS